MSAVPAELAIKSRVAVAAAEPKGNDMNQERQDRGQQDQRDQRQQQKQPAQNGHGQEELGGRKQGQLGRRTEDERGTGGRKKAGR